MESLRKLCNNRDYRYGTDFYGKSFLSIVRPLIDSIQKDGSMSLFVGKMGDKSPEAAATAILALYRIKVLPKSTLEKCQQHLIESNADYARISTQFSDSVYTVADVDQERAAWSAIEGRNVWSTSQILWTLIGTKYNGKHLPLLEVSMIWLRKQQYANGGWSFVAHNDNASNCYTTSLAIYTLKLASAEKWCSVIDRELNQSAINKGCRYLISQRIEKKGYWAGPKEVGFDNTIEPTTTATAIWALKFCAPDTEDIRDIIEQGISSLRKDIDDKLIWDNKITVDQYVPDTGLNKTGHGFSLSLPLILLRLGVEPRDEIILKGINLALNSKFTGGWEFHSTTVKEKSITGFNNPLTNYVGSGRPMTFTTGLVLWMIEEWHRCTVSDDIKNLKSQGHIDLKFTNAKGTRRITSNLFKSLVIMLAITIILLYYIAVSFVFNTPLQDIVSGMNLNNFSDTLDGVVKILLFIPVFIVLLALNLIKYNEISFKIIKRGFERVFY